MFVALYKVLFIPILTRTYYPSIDTELGTIKNLKLCALPLVKKSINSPLHVLDLLLFLHRGLYVDNNENLCYCTNYNH